MRLRVLFGALSDIRHMEGTASTTPRKSGTWHRSLRKAIPGANKRRSGKKAAVRNSFAVPALYGIDPVQRKRFLLSPSAGIGRIAI